MMPQLWPNGLSDRVYAIKPMDSSPSAAGDSVCVHVGLPVLAEGG